MIGVMFNMQFTELQLQILHWLVIILLLVAGGLGITLAIGFMKFTYDTWFKEK